MLFGAVALLLVGWLTAAVIPNETEAVRATRFELVDDSGTVRAVLGELDDETTGLAIYDDSSRVRLRAGHGPDATALFIRDDAGDTRVGVSQFAHGGGGFALHGEEMKGATVLYMKDGKGSLRLFDAEGNVTYQAPAP